MAEFNLAPFMGLDTYAHSSLIKDGYSPNLCNVVTTGGSIGRCKGVSVYKSGSYDKIAKHVYKNGSTKLLLFSGSDIYDTDNNVIASNYYSENDDVNFINYQLNDTYITIFTCKDKSPLKYDGNEFTALGGDPPKCEFIELHNERVFMAGDSANPDRVYYCESFDPEKWNTEVKSGYIDIPSWDGGKIRGIKSVFGDLVVFKDYGIYRIYGTYPGEFGVEKIPSNLGLIHNKSVALMGDKCFFVSDKGLCIYNGVSAMVVGEKRLNVLYERHLGENSLNTVEVVTIGEKRLNTEDANTIGEKRLNIPLLQSIGEKLIMQIGDSIYEYEDGVILKKQGFNVKAFLFANGIMYFIDKGGNLCIYDKGDTYLDKEIKAYWRSKEFDLGKKRNVKCVTDIVLTAKGTGDIKIKVVGELRAYTKTITLKDKVKDYILPLNARGRRFYVEIENKKGCDFEITSPTLILDIEEE